MAQHKGTQIIQTARLTLRPFQTSDAEAMYKNWCSDPEVSKYVTWETHKNVIETKTILKDWIAQYERPDYYNWAMEYEGEVIGNINANAKSGYSMAEIGYCMSRRFWNQGFMSEAAEAVTDFLFRDVGLHRLLIRNVRENPASGKVAEKCGYTLEGVERELHFGRDGKYHDIEARSLLREEWERRKSGAGVQLETERLLLRPLRESDFAAVHSYAGDPENTEFMFWGTNTEADTRRFLRSAQTERAVRDPENYDFAVVLKETGEVIGGVGISFKNELGEIGWILNRQFHHRGYATEAGSALLRYGFETLGLHRIKAHCDTRNIPSYHVMERLGMRREGEYKKARFTRGEWHDEFEYAILREEWTK